MTCPTCQSTYEGDATTECPTCRPSAISLRDYFAARALQIIVINDVSGRPENFLDYYSKGAYEWADAMLRARNNGEVCDGGRNTSELKP